MFGLWSNTGGKWDEGCSDLSLFVPSYVVTVHMVQKYPVTLSANKKGEQEHWDIFDNNSWRIQTAIYPPKPNRNLKPVHRTGGVETKWPMALTKYQTGDHRWSDQCLCCSRPADTRGGLPPRRPPPVPLLLLQTETHTELLRSRGSRVSSVTVMWGDAVIMLSILTRKLRLLLAPWWEIHSIHVYSYS